MEAQPSQSTMGRSSVDFPAYNSVSRSPTLYKTNSSTNSQSISAVLNNPYQAYRSPADWLPGLWSSSSAVAPPEFTTLIKPNAPNIDPPVSRSDLQQYLSLISEPYQRFEDIRKHATKEESIANEVEALVACLREVPGLYFKEDFALEDGATFRAACPFSTISENFVLQEKLSQYLDVVELHLVREISRRSDSFFEAQGQLQDLNAKIVEGCSRIRELKETVRLLDEDLVESAMRISNLNSTRCGLVALHQKLCLILNVNQALSALKLLVASSDCASALDITDDLQQLLDGDELTGLHCFRYLRDHVATSIDSVNCILSAEFMRTCIHHTVGTNAFFSSSTKTSTLTANGYGDKDNSFEGEDSHFRDFLLPIVIGLLRTGKLPSVLRIYRDTLTTEMKTAIKTAVAELLPILVSRPMELEFISGDRTTDADGGNSSLASKLRSMPSDCFVQLLSTVYKIVQVHLMRAAEVKRTIEWILSNLEGHYAAESVAAAIEVGASAAEMAQESEERSTLLPLYQKSIQSIPTASRVKQNGSTNFSNMSRNFRADVLRENAEAVFAACDAAHGRWAKLLGVRALLHPKLRLQEFLSIYSITQEFITATEKIGGRLGYSIRGTLQSQAKAFIEFQHDMRMTKIKAVLDQETWVEVDVPDEFQAIVSSLFYTEGSFSRNSDDPKEVGSDTDATECPEGTPSGSINSDSAQAQQIMADSTANEANVSSGSGQNEVGKENKKLAPKHDNIISSTKESGKSVSQMLCCGNVGYHIVNCGLILLKMLSEYMDMNNFLPALSAEIVHRVVELLKFFNTRTCQLVLGAGAMQVTGLKSITSKHLALASQVISFTYAIIPEIRRVLLIKVPEPRQVLLLSEIDRVAQDYKVHRDEIHSKLVQIMRERLLVHLRSLPQIVESWNRSESSDVQPSQFAKSVTKEVGFLHRVLSRTLHEADVQSIFRQVISLFHSQISEAFSRLDITTPQAKERLQRDVEHLLACIRSLPTDNSVGSDTPNWGQLDEFLAQKFKVETS